MQGVHHTQMKNKKFSILHCVILLLFYGLKGLDHSTIEDEGSMIFQNVRKHLVTQ
jgi:hypothetical protein